MFQCRKCYGKGILDGFILCIFLVAIGVYEINTINNVRSKKNAKEPCFYATNLIVEIP